MHWWSRVTATSHKDGSVWFVIAAEEEICPPCVIHWPQPYLIQHRPGCRAHAYVRCACPQCSFKFELVRQIAEDSCSTLGTQKNDTAYHHSRLKFYRGAQRNPGDTGGRTGDSEKLDNVHPFLYCGKCRNHTCDVRLMNMTFTKSATSRQKLAPRPDKEITDQSGPLPIPGELRSDSKSGVRSQTKYCKLS